MSGVSTLRSYQDVSTQTSVADDAVGPIALVAARTGWATYIQRILVNVGTSATETVTLQSDGTGALVLAILPVDSPLGVITFDFGEDGVLLPAGEGLEAVLSDDGYALTIVVQAYRKLPPDASVTVATAQNR